MEHDGGVSFAKKLTVGELAPVNYRALFRFTDKWGPLTRESHASATTIRVVFISFLDFCANFGKSYLELGVSNFGEPNFVGFLMKCSIL